jgi:hypothetical protein
MPFPQIVTCIVCEGVRQELLGKYTLVGVYGAAPHARVALVNFANPVDLCFFFCVLSGRWTLSHRFARYRACGSGH